MMAFTEWLPASMIKTIDSRYSAIEYNTLLSHLAGTIPLMEPHGDDVLLLMEHSSKQFEPAIRLKSQNKPFL